MKKLIKAWKKDAVEGLAGISKAAIATAFWVEAFLMLAALAVAFLCCFKMSLSETMTNQALRLKEDVEQKLEVAEQERNNYKALYELSQEAPKSE